MITLILTKFWYNLSPRLCDDTNQFEPTSSQPIVRQIDENRGWADLNRVASVFFVYLALGVNDSQSRSKLHDLRGRTLPNICSSRRLEGASEGGRG